MLSMNRLSTERRGQVIAALVEGNSIRATCRMTGVARNTVNRLLLDLGGVCADYLDRWVRNLDTTRIEADETWSFVYGKDRNLPDELRHEAGYGSVWTWVAIDADTKLIVSWLVGERSSTDCYVFLRDLRARLKNRVQLTTDGLGLYPPVIDALWRNGIDYAVMQKEYGSPPVEDQRRYSPAVCTAIDIRVMAGDPGPGPHFHVLR